MFRRSEVHHPLVPLRVSVQRRELLTLELGGKVSGVPQPSADRVEFEHGRHARGPSHTRCLVYGEGQHDNHGPPGRTLST